MRKNSGDLRKWSMVRCASFLLATLLIVGFVPMGALARLTDAGEAMTVAVSSQQELQRALDNAVQGTVITISQNITLTAPLTINKSGISLRLRPLSKVVTITAKSTRHLSIAGRDIDLVMDGVVLDGGSSGGGIRSTASSVALSGVVVQNCYTSGNGGGIEVASGSLYLEEGAVVQNNRAAAYGGGICTGAGTGLQLDGGEVRNNVAGAYGGGIFGGVGGDIQVDGGAVTGNQAILGGGIYCGTGGKLQLDGGEISLNTANGSTADAGKGGGIYMVAAVLRLDDGAVSGNQAFNGAGIYATGDGCSVIISGGAVTDNAAMGSNTHGGGIFLDTSYYSPNTLTLNGGRICNNSAVRGGGVFAGGSEPVGPSSNYGASKATVVVLNAGELSDNSAGLGGAVLADEGCAMSVYGAKIHRNTAEDGGGVWIAPLENLFVDSAAAFGGNKASTAVYRPSEEHISLHREKIQTTEFSGSFVYGYNNYDIHYPGGTAGVEQRHTVLFRYQGADAGDGEATREVYHGSAIGSLPAPERVGHTFLGWYTQAEGGGRVNATTTVNEDMELFARWEKDNYTLHFDYNGATAGDYLTEKEVEFGEAVGFLPIPVKGAEDAFIGWFSPSGAHYFPATIYKKEEDITLEARWEPVTIEHWTITFHYNQADSGYEEEYRVVLGGEEAGTLPNPKRSGYRFTGWFEEGSGAPFDETTHIIDDLDLYAGWEAVPWTVTFDYRGADSGADEATRSVAHNGGLGSLPAPVRAGYSLLGWSLDMEGEDLVTPDTVVSGDITLYAVWQPGTYTIYFDHQGADSESLPSSREVTYGLRIGSLPIPAKTGNLFSGWYDSPQGSGTYYGGGTSGKPYRYLEDKTLYARWQHNIYTILFDYQGADSGTEVTQKRVEYGDNLGALPFPEREGYLFGGWYTLPGGEGIRCLASTVYSVGDSGTLYAHWVAEDESGSQSQSRGSRNPGLPADLLEERSVIGEGQVPGGDNPDTGRPGRMWMLGVAAAFYSMGIGLCCGRVRGKRR